MSGKTLVDAEAVCPVCNRHYIVQDVDEDQPPKVQCDADGAELVFSPVVIE